MESNQTCIDWDSLQHIENNQESQKHFDENKPKFTKQCRLVYDLLLKGERLTTKDALLYHGIGDLRRRIKDLIDIYKIDVKSSYIEGKYKEYYL